MYAFLKLSDPHASEPLNRTAMAALESLTERVKADTAQAIDRILKATGKENVPHDLDKQALCSDIADAYCTRKHAFDLFEGSKAPTRVRRLRRIRRTAEKLATLLKEDGSADAMIAGRLTLPAQQPMQSRAHSIVPFIDRLRNATGEIEKAQERIAEKWRNTHKRNRDLRGRRVTAKEWLAGVSLALVFEWHFRKRAGRSRSMGKPSGPMVRFIGAVMEELGLPYSDEAIMRAISRRALLRAQQRKRKVLPLILRQI